MTRFVYNKGRRVAFVKAHTHEYVQHPNPLWHTHFVCRVCGMPVVKSAIDNDTYKHLIVEG